MDDRHPGRPQDNGLNRAPGDLLVHVAIPTAPTSNRAAGELAQWRLATGAPPAMVCRQ